MTEKKPSVLCSSGVNLIYLSEFNGIPYFVKIEFGERILKFLFF